MAFSVTINEKNKYRKDRSKPIATGSSGGTTESSFVEDVSFNENELTISQTNKEDIVVALDSYVRHDTNLQGLDSDEKENARTNIDVYSIDEVDTIIADSTEINLGFGLSLDEDDNIQLGDMDLGDLWAVNVGNLFQRIFGFIFQAYDSGSSIGIFGFDKGNSSNKPKVYIDYSNYLTGSGAGMEIARTVDGDDYEMKFFKDTEGTRQELVFTTDGRIVVVDNLNERGLGDADDYSATKQDLDYVTKKWVEDNFSGGESNSSTVGKVWMLPTCPALNQWNGLCYGSGMFVAVAGTGTGNRVMTSPDGIGWTLQTSAADNHWMAVTYGAGLYVAVSDDGTGTRVMTSPDGISWTLRTSAADNSWRSIAYGDGIFVVVSPSGTGNRVMTSPDGINWTIRVSAADNQWTSVTYGLGLFVAVAASGTGNRVMTSPDGINWTLRSSAADLVWVSVTFGSGLFVAVANGGTGTRIMSSPDGINWTSRVSPSILSWTSIAYGSGLFVAVANSGTGTRVIISSDGINWSMPVTTGLSTWGIMAFGDGVFVSCSQGASPGIMTSS